MCLNVRALKREREEASKRERKEKVNTFEQKNAFSRTRAFHISNIRNSKEVVCCNEISVILFPFIVCRNTWLNLPSVNSSTCRRSLMVIGQKLFISART